MWDDKHGKTGLSLECANLEMQRELDNWLDLQFQPDLKQSSVIPQSQKTKFFDLRLQYCRNARFQFCASIYTRNGDVKSARGREQLEHTHS